MSFVNLFSTFATFICGQNLLPDDASFINHFGNMLGNFFAGIWQAVCVGFYFVCKWLLAVVDFLQYFIQKLIGLDYWLKSGKKTIKGATDNDMLFKFLYNDMVQKVFRAMTAVFVVLLIIFTVVAIIRQEWGYITGGNFGDGKNSKNAIILKSLKAIALVLVFPMILIVGVISSNAILASLVNALNIDMASTFGGSIFAIAAQTGSKYRIYADGNERSAVSQKVNFYVNTTSGKCYAYGVGNDDNFTYESDYDEYLKARNGSGIKKYTIDSVFKAVNPNNYTKKNGFSGYCVAMQFGDGSTKPMMVYCSSSDKEKYFYYLKNVLNVPILSPNNKFNSDIFSDVKSKMKSKGSGSCPGFISGLRLDDIGNGDLIDACYNSWNYSSIYMQKTEFENTIDYNICENDVLADFKLEQFSTAKVMYNSEHISPYMDGGQFGVVQMKSEYYVMAEVIDFINEKQADLYVVDATSPSIKWDQSGYMLNNKWWSRTALSYGSGAEEFLAFMTSYSENCPENEVGNVLYTAKYNVGSELEGSKYIFCWKRGNNYIPLINGFENGYVNEDGKRFDFKSTYYADSYRGVVFAKGVFDTSSTNQNFGEPTYIQTSATALDGDDRVSISDEKAYYYKMEEYGYFSQYADPSQTKTTEQTFSFEGITLPSGFENGYMISSAVDPVTTDKVYKLNKLLVEDGNTTQEPAAFNESFLTEMTISLSGTGSNTDTYSARYANVKHSVSNILTRYLFVTSTNHYFVVEHDSKNEILRIVSVASDGTIAPIGSDTINGFKVTYQLKYTYKNDTISANETNIINNTMAAEFFEYTGQKGDKSIFKTQDMQFIKTTTTKTVNGVARPVINKAMYINVVFETDQESLVTFGTDANLGKILYAQPATGDANIQKSVYYNFYLYSFMHGYDSNTNNVIKCKIDSNGNTSFDTVDNDDVNEDMIFSFAVNQNFAWSLDETELALYDGKTYIATIYKNPQAPGDSEINATTIAGNVPTKINYDGNVYYNIKKMNAFAGDTLLKQYFNKVSKSLIIGFYRDNARTKFWQFDHNFGGIISGKFRFKMALFVKEIEKEELSSYFTLDDGYLFDYFFDGHVKLGTFYVPSKVASPIGISFWIIMIASALIIKVLGTSLWGVIKRFYEITLYYLAMPAVAAAMPLDEKDTRFKTAIQTPLIGKVLSTYGVILGINAFFVLLAPVRSLSNVFTAEDVATSGSYFLKHLPIPISLLNSYVYILFLLVAFTMINSLPGIISMIVTGKEGNDILSSGEKTKKQAGEAMKQAGGVISGQSMMEGVSKVAKGAASFIPGGAVAKKAAGGIAGGVNNIMDRFKDDGPTGDEGEKETPSKKTGDQTEEKEGDQTEDPNGEKKTGGTETSSNRTGEKGDGEQEGPAGETPTEEVDPMETDVVENAVTAPGGGAPGAKPGETGAKPGGTTTPPPATKEGGDGTTTETGEKGDETTETGEKTEPKAGGEVGEVTEDQAKENAGGTAVGDNVPGAKPGEPGAKPGEPGAKPGEPGAKPGEPGAEGDKKAADAGDGKKPVPSFMDRVRESSKKETDRVQRHGAAVKSAFGFIGNGFRAVGRAMKPSNVKKFIAKHGASFMEKHPKLKNAFDKTKSFVKAIDRGLGHVIKTPKYIANGISFAARKVGNVVRAGATATASFASRMGTKFMAKNPWIAKAARGIRAGAIGVKTGLTVAKNWVKARPATIQNAVKRWGKNFKDGAARLSNRIMSSDNKFVKFAVGAAVAVTARGYTMYRGMKAVGQKLAKTKVGQSIMEGAMTRKAERSAAKAERKRAKEMADYYAPDRDARERGKKRQEYANAEADERVAKKAYDKLGGSKKAEELDAEIAKRQAEIQAEGFDPNSAEGKKKVKELKKLTRERETLTIVEERIKEASTRKTRVGNEYQEKYGVTVQDDKHVAGRKYQLALDIERETEVEAIAARTVEDTKNNLVVKRTKREKLQAEYEREPEGSDKKKKIKAQIEKLDGEIAADEETLKTTEKRQASASKKKTQLQQTYQESFGVSYEDDGDIQLGLEGTALGGVTTKVGNKVQMARDIELAAVEEEAAKVQVELSGEAIGRKKEKRRDIERKISNETNPANLAKLQAQLKLIDDEIQTEEGVQQTAKQTQENAAKKKVDLQQQYESTFGVGYQEDADVQVDSPVGSAKKGHDKSKQAARIEYFAKEEESATEQIAASEKVIATKTKKKEQLEARIKKEKDPGKRETLEAELKTITEEITAEEVKKKRAVKRQSEASGKKKESQEKYKTTFGVSYEDDEDFDIEEDRAASGSYVTASGKRGAVHKFNASDGSGEGRDVNEERGVHFSSSIIATGATGAGRTAGSIIASAIESGQQLTTEQIEAITVSEFNEAAVSDTSFVENKTTARANIVRNKVGSKVGKKVVAQVLSTFAETVVDETLAGDATATTAKKVLTAVNGGKGKAGLLTTEMREQLILSTMSAEDVQRYNGLGADGKKAMLKDYRMDTTVSAEGEIGFVVTDKHGVSVNVDKDTTNQVVTSMMSSERITDVAINNAVNATGTASAVDSAIAQNVAMAIDFNNENANTTTSALASAVYSKAAEDDDIVAEAILRHVEGSKGTELYDRFQYELNLGEDTDFSDPETRTRVLGQIKALRKSGNANVVSTMESASYGEEFTSVVKEQVASGAIKVTAWELADDETRERFAAKTQANLSEISSHSILEGANEVEQTNIIANTVTNVMQQSGGSSPILQQIQQSGFIANVTEQELKGMDTSVMQALVGKQNVEELTAEDKAFIGFIKAKNGGSFNGVYPQDADKYKKAYANANTRVAVFASLGNDVKATAVAQNNMTDVYAQAATQDGVLALTKDEINDIQADYVAEGVINASAREELNRMYRAYTGDSTASIASAKKEDIVQFLSSNQAASNIVMSQMRSVDYSFAKHANANYEVYYARTEEERKKEVELSVEAVRRNAPASVLHAFTSSNVENKEVITRDMFAEFAGIDNEESETYQQVMDTVKGSGIDVFALNRKGHDNNAIVAAYKKAQMFGEIDVDGNGLSLEVISKYLESSPAQDIETLKKMQSMTDEEHDAIFAGGKRIGDVATTLFTERLTGEQKEELIMVAATSGYDGLSVREQDSVVTTMAAKDGVTRDNATVAKLIADVEIPEAHKETITFNEEAITDKSFLTFMGLKNVSKQTKKAVEFKARAYAKRNLLLARLRKNGITSYKVDGQDVEIDKLDEKTLSYLGRELDDRKNAGEAVAELTATEKKEIEAASATDAKREVYSELMILHRAPGSMRTRKAFTSAETRQEALDEIAQTDAGKIFRNTTVEAVETDTSDSAKMAEYLRKATGSDVYGDKAIADMSDDEKRAAILAIAKDKGLEASDDDVSAYVLSDAGAEDKKRLIAGTSSMSYYELQGVTAGKSSADIYSEVRTAVVEGKKVDEIYRTQGGLITSADVFADIKANPDAETASFVANRHAGKISTVSTDEEHQIAVEAQFDSIVRETGSTLTEEGTYTGLIGKIESENQTEIQRAQYYALFTEFASHKEGAEFIKAIKATKEYKDARKEVDFDERLFIGKKLKSSLVSSVYDESEVAGIEDSAERYSTIYAKFAESDLYATYIEQIKKSKKHKEAVSENEQEAEKVEEETSRALLLARFKKNGISSYKVDGKDVELDQLSTKQLERISKTALSGKKELTEVEVERIKKEVASQHVVLTEEQLIGRSLEAMVSEGVLKDNAAAVAAVEERTRQQEIIMRVNDYDPGMAAQLDVVSANAIDLENKRRLANGGAKRIAAYAKVILDDPQLAKKARIAFRQQDAFGGKDIEEVDEVTRNNFLATTFLSTLDPYDRRDVQREMSAVDISYAEDQISTYDTQHGTNKTQEIIEKYGSIKEFVSSAKDRGVSVEQALEEVGVFKSKEEMQREAEAEYKTAKGITDRELSGEEKRIAYAEYLDRKVVESMEVEDFEAVYTETKLENYGEEPEAFTRVKKDMIRRKAASGTISAVPDVVEMSPTEKREYEYRRNFIQQEIRNDSNPQILANTFRNTTLVNEDSIVESIIASMARDRNVSTETIRQEVLANSESYMTALYGRLFRNRGSNTHLSDVFEKIAKHYGYENANAFNGAENVNQLIYKFMTNPTLVGQKLSGKGMMAAFNAARDEAIKKDVAEGAATSSDYKLGFDEQTIGGYLKSHETIKDHLVSLAASDVTLALDSATKTTRQIDAVMSSSSLQAQTAVRMLDNTVKKKDDLYALMREMLTSKTSRYYNEEIARLFADKSPAGQAAANEALTSYINANYNQLKTNLALHTFFDAGKDGRLVLKDSAKVGKGSKVVKPTEQMARAIQELSAENRTYSTRVYDELSRVVSPSSRATIAEKKNFFASDRSSVSSSQVRTLGEEFSSISGTLTAIGRRFAAKKDGTTTSITGDGLFSSLFTISRNVGTELFNTTRGGIVKIVDGAFNGAVYKLTKKLPKTHAKYDQWNAIIQRKIEDVKKGQGAYKGFTRAQREAEVAKLESQKIVRELPANYYDMSTDEQANFIRQQNLYKHEAFTTNISQVIKQNVRVEASKTSIFRRFADSAGYTFGFVGGMASEGVKTRHKQDLDDIEAAVARYNATKAMRNRSVDFGTNFENFARNYLSDREIDRVNENAVQQFLSAMRGQVAANGKVINSKNMRDLKFNDFTEAQQRALMQIREDEFARKLNKNLAVATQKVARDNKVDPQTYSQSRGVTTQNVRYRNGADRFLHMRSQIKTGGRSSYIGSVESRIASENRLIDIQAKYDKIVQFNSTFKGTKEEYRAALAAFLGDEELVRRIYDRYNSTFGSKISKELNLERSSTAGQKRTVLNGVLTQMQNEVNRAKYNGFIPANGQTTSGYIGKTFTNATTRIEVEKAKNFADELTSTIKQFRLQQKTLSYDQLYGMLSPALRSGFGARKRTDFMTWSDDRKKEELIRYLQRKQEQAIKKVNNNMFFSGDRHKLVNLNGTYVERSSVTTTGVSPVIMNAIKTSGSAVYQTLVQNYNTAKSKVDLEEKNIERLSRSLRDIMSGPQNAATRREADKIRRALEASRIKLKTYNSMYADAESRKKAFEQSFAAREIQQAIAKNVGMAYNTTTASKDLFSRYRFPVRLPNGSVEYVQDGSTKAKEVTMVIGDFLRKYRYQIQYMIRQAILPDLQEMRKDIGNDFGRNYANLKAVTTRLKSQIKRTAAEVKSNAAESAAETRELNNKLHNNLTRIQTTERELIFRLRALGIDVNDISQIVNSGPAVR